MKRSKTTGGRVAKRRAAKAAAGQRRVIANSNSKSKPKSAGNIITGLRQELEQKTRQLDEALEQQAATAEVLRVISNSPGELQPVFHAMLENATRICDAKIGILFRYVDGAYSAVSLLGVTPAYAEYLNRGSIRPGPATGLGRVASMRQTVHIADTLADQVYADRDPFRLATAELGGARSLLNVPMLKDGALIGAIGIYRQDVRPFADKQIELVTNFAAQAVIAIENTRLLSELRQSLEQQTATAQVLQIINSSAGELQPVFQSMLENAVRLCEAEFGNLFLYDGQAFQAAALHRASQAYVEVRRRPVIVRDTHPELPMVRLTRTKEVIHIADVRTERSYLDLDRAMSELVDGAGARTLLLVPMLKDDELGGAFAIYRKEIRPFTDKQIDLVKSFAAQAVIAIENTRLLSELRESLEQQTATADVLRVISSSPGDLQPVFDAILKNATRICHAKFGQLYLAEKGVYRAGAMYNVPPDYLEFRRIQPLVSMAGDSAMGRVAATKLAVHVADIAADTSYQTDERRRFVSMTGARTIVSVPMLKEGELVGAINVYRDEVRPFGEKQMELLTNFASQAVIAIENARLLNELRQRTSDLSKSLEDLRTAQDRLVQTEKLASLGQLTAGIAHEIKNPLNFVNNFSSLSVELIDELQEELSSINIGDEKRGEIAGLADTLKGNLDKIAQHGKRADAIVKNMLLHSREGSGERRSVDVNALVEESLNLAYHGARAEKQGFNVTLERSFDVAAGEVDLYPQEVTRVLLNIIANGFYAAHKRQAQSDGEAFEPTVTASTRNLGDRVEIRIRDNGTGIPPEVQEKMFNPFFTTKPAGEGTGLGLSISHDIIVKQHSGTIEVDSRSGEFTEFRIVLPRAASLAGFGR
ncbi:MAG: GAF domain-containing protein [Xanthobacteraceae bacterium]